jgi:hypothetical protein
LARTPQFQQPRALNGLVDYWYSLLLRGNRLEKTLRLDTRPVQDERGDKETSGSLHRNDLLLVSED